MPVVAFPPPPHSCSEVPWGLDTHISVGPCGAFGPRQRQPGIIWEVHAQHERQILHRRKTGREFNYAKSVEREGAWFCLIPPKPLQERPASEGVALPGHALIFLSCFLGMIRGALLSWHMCSSGRCPGVLARGQRRAGWYPAKKKKKSSVCSCG